MCKLGFGSADIQLFVSARTKWVDLFDGIDTRCQGLKVASNIAVACDMTHGEGAVGRLRHFAIGAGRRWPGCDISLIQISGSWSRRGWIAVCCSRQYASSPPMAPYVSLMIGLSCPLQLWPWNRCRISWHIDFQSGRGRSPRQGSRMLAWAHRRTGWSIARTQSSLPRDRILI
jgi:hypothetical protein